MTVLSVVWFLCTVLPLFTTCLQHALTQVRLLLIAGEKQRNIFYGGFFNLEFDSLKVTFVCFLPCCLFSPAHTGMYNAAYTCVLSSFSTADVQRTFCIAPNSICTPPPAAAPYSFEPVCPFTASAPTHGESWKGLLKSTQQTLGCLNVFRASAKTDDMLFSLSSLYRG